MRIAITGGTGFVGGHLARALADEGHEVVVIARGADRRDESVPGLPGARFVASDLSDGAKSRQGDAKAVFGDAEQGSSLDQPVVAGAVDGFTPKSSLVDPHRTRLYALRR